MSMSDNGRRECMGVGDRIRKARQAAGLSQGALADKVGQVQTAISSWERGRTEPTRQQVARVAKALGLPVAELELGAPGELEAPVAASGLRECSGPWGRLRWARLRRGFETAEAAAEALGLKPGTYRAYEREPDASKHIALDHTNAARFAQMFGVSWTWLLTGEGAPRDGVVEVDCSGRRTTFIRAWRKHRGLSLLQVVDLLHNVRDLELSDSQLSRIERGEQPYTQDQLEGLADVLATDPASLLVRDPADPEGVWSVWDALAPAQRMLAVEILKVLQRTRDGG